jgi:glycerol-3-phosphate dehydrogenase
MWSKGWRKDVWKQIDQPWDILVIGGGITGAGIINLAARSGLKVLLVEANDFAYGTSSRSSKLVHGGFRYLRNRQFSVTREAVRERERLLHQARYLVEPLEFILPVFGNRSITRRVYQMGVTIYDILAPKWVHGHLNKARTQAECPQLTNPRVSDSFYYYDAEVDDTRLVLRVIQEAVQAGGIALNYARVDHLLYDDQHQVTGAVVIDQSVEDNGRTAEVHARVIINATGPWTDNLRQQVGGEKRIRKQRGSHLAFPKARLPLDKAITFFHPRDKRAMFVFPWEGVTIIGTTDLDHPQALEEATPEPVISCQEVDYIMEAVAYLFPESHLGKEDILSSIAGLRPIVSSGTANPSKESRAHSIWDEEGLVTITGGKLTTYRLMAFQTLQSIRERLKPGVIFNPLLTLFQAPPIQIKGLDSILWKRLAGRYGVLTGDMIGAVPPDELVSMPDLPSCWAEIRWAARSEAVEHLDDLLLRRLRLGLTAPRGGLDWIDRIREIAQPELGWDDTRWQAEEDHYRTLWQTCYSVPSG